jgi:enoyl-CoA hydratase
MALVESAVDAAGIATVTVNRPEALNALNAQVLTEIRDTVHALRTKARGIVVTGAGKAFVAGADIAAMADLDSRAAAVFSRKGHEAFQELADFPGLVVAAVNGYALGGGLELALACDVIVASEKASLGQPEVSLGVVPGFGGSQRLPRRIGAARAKRLLMTGERLGAQDALAVGLVDKVVPHEQVVEEARKLVAATLANGPLAVAAAKRLVDDGAHVGLATALSLEADAFGAAFATHDQKEGMRAFLEKRKPAFAGR